MQDGILRENRHLRRQEIAAFYCSSQISKMGDKAALLKSLCRSSACCVPLKLVQRAAYVPRGCSEKLGAPTNLITSKFRVLQ